jgi:hypothetical protein
MRRTTELMWAQMAAETAKARQLEANVSVVNAAIEVQAARQSELCDRLAVRFDESLMDELSASIQELSLLKFDRGERIRIGVQSVTGKLKVAS